MISLMENGDKSIRKQGERAEETKRSIAESAAKLFTARGYEAVTMREIAKDAGCSHTTIYLYFKDKEVLLEQLAIPPLQSLEALMLSIKENKEWSATEKLKEKSRQFLRFCLSHKSMVAVILGAKSVRVDEKNPVGDVNQLRNRIFGYLTDEVEHVVPVVAEHERIDQSRVYFFMLYGMVFTYMNSEEPLEPLLERILPILDKAIEVVLAGMQHKQDNIQPMRTVKPEKQQDKKQDKLEKQEKQEKQEKLEKQQDKKQDKKRKDKKSKKQEGK
ncbi:transcriptional regulator, TetR family [Paenibacillus sp. 1_12]|uniref:TetR/AcrR family transcriptional regulator n=1 Tax=Paenibacillus sp. 1_12 TaxID=1566278 RepID=UPI0008F2F906|nr:TetR/AcrR family transcriptional regulator [Paenibacillus sp. 1_12]SFL65348.1 transcriptional regulator, TetR family [Paenibacillus sp. 1_12]